VVTVRRALQLNYNHLHYFHVAAVEGSVGMAAQLLGVTQPTISEQLRTLERTLGVVLFERQPSGLKLTDAGRLAFRHTSIMFGAGERMTEELEQGKVEAIDVLRIGVSNSIAREAMPDLLTPLLGIDKCVPSIRVADYVELARDLRNGKLEILLADFEPSKTERRSVECTLVERTQLVAIAHPNVKPNKTWSDVGLLQYRLGTKLRTEVETFLSTRALTPRIAAEADDAWMLLNAVVRTPSAAIVPRQIAYEAITAKRVMELDAFPAEHIGVYALFATGAEIPTQAVERLVAQTKDL
jgi:LysR family transcriptional activator of nhaA